MIKSNEVIGEFSPFRMTYKERIINQQPCPLDCFNNSDLKIVSLVKVKFAIKTISLPSIVLGGNEIIKCYFLLLNLKGGKSSCLNMVFFLP